MLPSNLKALADELDRLGGQGPALGGLDGLPDFSGTDFEPIRSLGTGGMGSVYLAQQISLRRRVAVKVMSAARLNDPAFRALFSQEARLVGGLHHPNIVHVYAAGECGRHPYFAMEYVDGTTAAERTFTSLEEVLKLGIVLAEALQYAHRCGVVHRDVKPSNVFIAANGTVKLGDFGLSCLAGNLASGGTHRYRAPEQRDDTAATPQSDQYALAVLLLERADAFPQTRRNADLVAIFACATAADPAARYADMEAFAADLKRFLAHEPVAARPLLWPRRLALWARRNPPAAIAAALSAFLTVGLVVSLAVGYVHTHTALAETRRAQAETERALAQTEKEAAAAALSLAAALAPEERPRGGDFRATELARALETAEALAARFPENAEIRSALGRLRYATEAHARFKNRRRGPSSPRP